MTDKGGRVTESKFLGRSGIYQGPGGKSVKQLPERAFKGKTKTKTQKTQSHRAKIPGSTGRKNVGEKKEQRNPREEKVVKDTLW